MPSLLQKSKKRQQDDSESSDSDWLDCGNENVVQTENEAQTQRGFQTEYGVQTQNQAQTQNEDPTQNENRTQRGFQTDSGVQTQNRAQTQIEIPIERRLNRRREISIQNSIDRSLAKTYSIKEMLDLAKLNEFPMRVFIVNGIVKKKTVVQSLQFRCIIGNNTSLTIHQILQVKL